MNSQFAGWAISVLVLVGSLPLRAQQAGPRSQQMLPQCSAQAGIPSRSTIVPCKPVLGDTKTQQPSNDLPRSDDQATYIEFDVPGSKCEASFPYCTTPVAINLLSAVTGYYADANASLHGFVRSPLGAITTFDAPGASCASYFSVCTWPVGINLLGAITGFYCNTATCHGFVRTPGGSIITFDPPGSVFTFYTTGGINDAGVITGSYYDANFLGHGFLRTPGGNFISFDAPGAVNGTVPSGINDAGEIVGSYFDTNYAGHGFVRAPNGSTTTFDPPGSIYTSANAIDLEGTVTGWWQDASYAIHGFVRSTKGNFTSFDGPGSMQTMPSAINLAETTVGNFGESGGLHGFIRADDGTFTSFDPPGSAEPSYTFANGINALGVVTGWYIDPSYLGHGFLRIPIP